ncbi:MAG: molybdate ABC transporter substrate-binding protein [Candidatus Binatia bacterium]
MGSCRSWVLAVALVVGVAAGARAEAARPGGLAVAAAADLRFAMDEIVAAFRRTRPDVAVTVTYGSSGQFASQLANGAPFDVFFSADAELPRQLAAQGLVLEGSEFLYGVGRIVLWVPRASGLDVRRLGAGTLREPAVHHVAIANPRHAPYGRAAEAALQSLGLAEAVRDKLVLGENAAQTAQLVQSGAAEVGVIALALALAPALRAEGEYWPVPLDAYPRMDQGGVIMKTARDPGLARAFCAFVLGPSGRATLERWGFSPPRK